MLYLTVITTGTDSRVQFHTRLLAVWKATLAAAGCLCGAFEGNGEKLKQNAVWVELLDQLKSQWSSAGNDSFQN